MMPVIAWNALHASGILRQAMTALRVRTVEGLIVDTDRTTELLERSTAAATALSPYIGYETTAEIAKDAVRTGKSIRSLVLERRLLDEARLDAILSADAMTRGGVVGEQHDTRPAN
jgi:aspartate ammonia-lyase